MRTKTLSLTSLICLQIILSIPCLHNKLYAADAEEDLATREERACRNFRVQYRDAYYPEIWRDVVARLNEAANAKLPGSLRFEELPQRRIDAVLMDCNSARLIEFLKSEEKSIQDEGRALGGEVYYLDGFLKYSQEGFFQMTEDERTRRACKTLLALECSRALRGWISDLEAEGAAVSPAPEEGGQ